MTPTNGLALENGQLQMTMTMTMPMTMTVTPTNGVADTAAGQQEDNYKSFTKTGIHSWYLTHTFPQHEKSRLVY